MGIEGKINDIEITFPPNETGEIILITTEEKQVGAYREAIRRKYIFNKKLFLELLNIGIRIKENELKEKGRRTK